VTKENLNKNNSPKVRWTTFRDRQHVDKTAVWNETAQAEVWLRAFANTVMSLPGSPKGGNFLDRLSTASLFGENVLLRSSRSFSWTSRSLLPLLRFVVPFRVRNPCQQFLTSTDVRLDMRTNHQSLYYPTNAHNVKT
jgi:hypothetical protein